MLLDNEGKCQISGHGWKRCVSLWPKTGLDPVFRSVFRFPETARLLAPR
jgi:hypothetical protein